MAAGRLETLKALLPEDELLDRKYVAELHTIIDFMEGAAVLNLKRFRMSSRSRSELRINILALLSVCEYQSGAPSPLNGPQVEALRGPRWASRNIH